MGIANPDSGMSLAHARGLRRTLNEFQAKLKPLLVPSLFTFAFLLLTFIRRLPLSIDQTRYKAGSEAVVDVDDCHI